MYSYINQKDNLFKGKIFVISIFYEVSRTFWRNHQSKIMAWNDLNSYFTQEYDVDYDEVRHLIFFTILCLFFSLLRKELEM